MDRTNGLVERRTGAFRLGLLLALGVLIAGRSWGDLDHSAGVQLLVVAVVTAVVLALQELARSRG